jgi:hypothetical protein
MNPLSDQGDNSHELHTAMILATLALVFLATASLAEEKRIMVFGGSNSWGWVPQEAIVPTTRYDAATRQPGVLAGRG